MHSEVSETHTHQSLVEYETNPSEHPDGISNHTRTGSPTNGGNPEAHGDDASNIEAKQDSPINATPASSQDGSMSLVDQTAQSKGGRPWLVVLRMKSTETFAYYAHLSRRKTTFLRWGPLSGIACTLLAATSLVVSLGILLGSDGVPVANW
jgi:hypothetical protein